MENIDFLNFDENLDFGFLMNSQDQGNDSFVPIEMIPLTEVNPSYYSG